MVETSMTSWNMICREGAEVETKNMIYRAESAKYFSSVCTHSSN